MGATLLVAKFSILKWSLHAGEVEYFLSTRRRMKEIQKRRTYRGTTAKGQE